MNIESNSFNTEPKIEMEWTQDEVRRAIEEVRQELSSTGAVTGEMDDLNTLAAAVEKTIDPKELGTIHAAVRRLTHQGDQRQLDH